MVANGQGNGIAWDFRRCPYIDFQGFWGCWGMCTRKTGVIAFQCIWGKCWLVRKTGLLVCRTRNTAMSLTTAARFLNIPIVDIVGRKWSSIFLQMCQLRALLPFFAHTTIQMSAEFRRCPVSQGAISQQQLEWMKTARTWDDLRYRWELQGAETGSNLAFFCNLRPYGRQRQSVTDHGRTGIEVPLNFQNFDLGRDRWTSVARFRVFSLGRLEKDPGFPTRTSLRACHQSKDRGVERRGIRHVTQHDMAWRMAGGCNMMQWRISGVFVWFVLD